MESPFSRIRAAVAEGRLAASTAARALHEIDAESEEAWLEDAIAGLLPARRKCDRAPVREWTGDDARVVHEARTLARLHLGQPVSDAAADRQILSAWRAKTPRAQILSEAMADPPAPAPLPEWPDGPDPADVLVGEWRTPEGPEEALALLRMTQFVRRDRRVQLGPLLTIVVEERLFEAAGCRTMEGWVREHLSLDVRTTQRLRRAAALAEEADHVRGLDLDRADFLDAVATDDTLPEWEIIVPMVGRAELERVRVLARGEAETALRTAYTTAIAEATKSADTGRRRYVSLAATFPPPPAPRRVDAHPEFPEAARWYLEAGRPPKQRGIGRIKELAAYTCVLPECCARSVRAEVHHRVFRSRGGTDADENLHCHCTACHLRLIHAGHVTVSRQGDVLVYSFRDREIWVFGTPAFL